MLIDEVLQCNFSRWYPRFRSVTIESDIIPLANTFRDYLLADGIILPKACFQEMDSNFTEDEVDQELPEFPQLEEAIRRSIDKYGAIFPKLNWSACDDARWIQAAGTKCSTLSEVFLLLKSSDKIVHDLTEAFKHCTDYDEEANADRHLTVQYELIARKWLNMNPSMEFRCFISRNQMLGICQRDTRSYYEYIHREKDQIIEDILQFFRTKIQNKFTIENFVIDVYRPRVDGRITLIDINPFGEVTDSLLFDWDELRSKQNAPLPPQFRDFRYIENNIGVQTQRYEMNSLPLDVFTGQLNEIELNHAPNGDTVNGNHHTNGNSS